MRCPLISWTDLVTVARRIFEKTKTSRFDIFKRKFVVGCEDISNLTSVGLCSDSVKWLYRRIVMTTLLWRLQMLAQLDYFRDGLVKTNMMPLAPTPIVAVPSKPKIGFSIDSIVGGANQPPSPHSSPVHYSESSAPLSPSSDSENRLNGSPQRSPIGSPKPPIMVPGIPAHTLVRPSPTYEGNMMPKGGFMQPELMHNHPSQHPFALAAHFQGAALAAALSSGQHQFNQPSPLNPHTPPRDSYPLYPWLLSRHGRIFPHRFPGGKSIFGQSEIFN